MHSAKVISMETIHTDRWVAWMRAQSWSQATITKRLSLIKSIRTQTGTSPVMLSIEQILDVLASPTITGATRRAYWLWLRSWFGWCVQAGLREDNPTDKIAKPHAGRRAIRVIDRGHVERLLAVPVRSRTRLMILLGAYQGLRVSEIAKIHSRDVDLISGTLHVIGKGDVSATLPLHPLVASHAAGRAGWWFPSSQNASGHVLGASVGDTIGDAMRRASIPGTAHSLRHWYATELLSCGVDLRTIQQLMRHASLATTEQYLHLDDSARRAAVLRLPDLTRPAVLRVA